MPRYARLTPNVNPNPALATYAPIVNGEADLLTVQPPSTTVDGRGTLLINGTLGSLTSYTVTAYAVDQAGVRYALYSSGALTANAKLAVPLSAPGVNLVVITALSVGVTTSSSLQVQVLTQVPA